MKFCHWSVDKCVAAYQVIITDRYIVICVQINVSCI